jgi:predicted glycosyltransferase
LTFEGTEKDLDKLLDRMALALLRQTQPFRYGNLFIETDHRNAETVFRELAATATSDNEHGWALISLANVLALGNGKNREALSLGDEAISLMPQNPAAYTFS